MVTEHTVTLDIEIWFLYQMLWYIDRHKDPKEWLAINKLYVMLKECRSKGITHITTEELKDMKIACR